MFLKETWWWFVQQGILQVRHEIRDTQKGVPKYPFGFPLVSLSFSFRFSLGFPLKPTRKCSHPFRTTKMGCPQKIQRHFETNPNLLASSKRSLFSPVGLKGSRFHSGTQFSFFPGRHFRNRTDVLAFAQKGTQKGT